MESFEEKLEKTAKRLGIETDQIPRNIAIIMDGNGRWAQGKGLPRAEGHSKGGETVKRIAQCCVDFGIESLTLYSFSIENWKRPRDEVNSLMHLYTQYLVEIRQTLAKDNVKLIHLGELEGLPPIVQVELMETIEMSSAHTGMKLALALNYGSRTEIANAVKKIAQNYKDGKLSLEDINPECISRHLYTDGLEDPDLLIRTANEMRISNFLLWQISYSEFYVTKTLWPDFMGSDLEEAILAYAKRKRRFGGIKSV